MSWADIKGYIDILRTDRVMEQLQAWNVGDLNTNPWFLGGFAVVILICYFIGWKTVAGVLTGLGGFVIVLSLAIGRGTGTEGITDGSGGLWILVGGGAVAVALFIYLIFIKTE